MCTALTLSGGGHYFGRTLDLDRSYGEQVVIIPRNYPLPFRKMPPMEQHYAMIGMALVLEDYPLYYDGVNETGLAMAGLNFPDNAVYYPQAEGMDNITPFEFIPWVLGQCADLAQARELLQRINLWNSPFSPQLPLSPLHWIISYRGDSIVVETMAEGMKIYENPVGVMANNPPFDFMLHYLSMFRNLSSAPSENLFSPGTDFPVYCQGLAAVGLPGDWSSPSRFVRAAFSRLNSLSGSSEGEQINQFFHLMDTVAMPRGCVRLEDGGCDITVYTACCDQGRGIYYYTTYENRAITGVDMHRADLDGETLIVHPLRTQPNITM